MTLKELKSFAGKNGLLKIQDEKIARLEARLVRHSEIDTSGTPRNPTPRNSTEDLMIDILAAKERRDELQSQLDYINTWISQIDDDLIQFIILRRFVDDKRWQEIADELGGNNTEYSVKKLCYRYIIRSENE